VTVVVYVYALYPGWLGLRRKWRSRPVHWSRVTPSISIIMAVKNEAAAVTAKLENLAKLDYPADRVEIIVVSDGSTDATNELLHLQAGIRSILLPVSEGKASALNYGLAVAEGEIVVFVDARQKIDPQALRFLVGNFADESVGCVSGELVLVNQNAVSKAKAVGLYWKIEKKIRRLESETGSVVGATGALYAVRRKLITPLPVGTLCDDVYIPLQVVRQHHRVVFEPRAVALDVVFSDWRREFLRKVRTLTGNYQLLRLAPWLVTSKNPLRFEFISHKLLRLFVPFALLLALSSSLLANGWFYRASLVAQLCFYGLGLLTFVMPRRRLPRLAAISFTFVMLNAAAALGLIKFVTAKKDVWETPSLKPGQVR
jgi:biofilm PGA synthesis N-glycosyltransferase PgaC